MAQATVKSIEVKKEGVGKKGPWKLYKVVTEDGQEPTGFDYVSPGDVIDIESVQNGEYTNLNYKKAKLSAAPAAAPAASGGGTSDKRVLKLLVLVAQQVGVDQQEVMAILEDN